MIIIIPAFSGLFVLSTIVPYIAGQLDLNCNFDQQTFCEWTNALNANEDDFDWQIADSVQVDGFHSIPRTLAGSGFFALAQGKFRDTEAQAARAWLRSPVLDRLDQSASLSFNYWKAAAPPVLQVCTRDAGEAELRCLDTVSGLGQQNWVQRVVTIPTNPLPFQIIIAANNFVSQLDTIGLDDIVFTRGQKDVNRQSNNFGNSGYRPFAGSSRRNVGGIDPLNSINSINSLNPGPFFPPLVNPSPPFNPNTLTRFTETQLLEIPDNPLLPQEFGSDLGNVGLLGNELGTGDEQAINSLAPFQPPLSPIVPVPDIPNNVRVRSSTGSCAAISCTFNNDYCQWENDHFVDVGGQEGEVVAVEKFDWRLKNFGSPFAGIPGAESHESYLFVSGDNRTPNQAGVLRSGRFIIPEGASLQFSVYFADTNVGRLRLYRNNFEPNNVLWHAMGNRDIGTGWKRVTQPVPASGEPLTIMLVADQLNGGSYIGLDDMRLVDSTDREIGCTTLRETALARPSIRRRSQFGALPVPVINPYYWAAWSAQQQQLQRQRQQLPSTYQSIDFEDPLETSQSGTSLQSPRWSSSQSERRVESPVFPESAYRKSGLGPSAIAVPAGSASHRAARPPIEVPSYLTQFSKSTWGSQLPANPYGLTVSHGNPRQTTSASQGLPQYRPTFSNYVNDMSDAIPSRLRKYPNYDQMAALYNQYQQALKQYQERLLYQQSWPQIA